MQSARSSTSYDCFAVTAPGLEALCAAELRALGIARARARDDAGVAWTGTFDSLVRANLWLRTASRVVVRIARFRATEFYELERQAKRIPWERFVHPRAHVEFRVTCRKSKLYHSDAVAQRFADAIARQTGAIVARSSEETVDDDELDAPDRQLFLVRFVHDACTVSADSSGALLHLRGYRQALAKAPLRETLAAAVLLGSGWAGDTPLVDPMCGSGTIPIEAALIARRIAPGRARTFAFMNWPEADATLTSALTDDARERELPSSPVRIAGSDRDAGAIDAARANAARAGVANDVEFAQRTISALPPADGASPGMVASNPPYGIRIGDRDRLRNLYAQLGNVLRRTRSGWTLALLSADRRLERFTELEFEERLRTRNGGIPVRLIVANIDDGTELGKPVPRTRVR